MRDLTLDILLDVFVETFIINSRKIWTPRITERAVQWIVYILFSLMTMFWGLGRPLKKLFTEISDGKKKSDLNHKNLIKIKQIQFFFLYIKICDYFQPCTLCQCIWKNKNVGQSDTKIFPPFILSIHESCSGGNKYQHPWTFSHWIL